MATIGERERIAQEIHDGLAQSLYSIVLQLKACRKLLHTDPKSAEQKLLQLEKLVNKEIREIRQRISALKENQISTRRLSSTLKEYTKEFSGLNGLSGRCKIIGEERLLPAPVEDNLYQIVHEALSNVAKHAEAKKVEVRLKFDPAELELSVEDNGKGFDVAKKLSGRGGSAGMGIRNIESRVSQLSGNLRILSRPGTGTRISVVVPYKGSLSGGESGGQGVNC